MVAIPEMESQHKAPILWVETLWLLESLEPLAMLREIQLRRGLNLVLSEPSKVNSGHGVGKTAFCQLLRFILDDPHWDQGTPLRDELREAIPEGAIAAKVHLGDECWTVLKPWKHQKQYRATLQGNWQELVRNEVSNDYDQYQRSLVTHLVKPLPVAKLPGADQAIKWSQILAWLSRDQGSRYQSYYHWRKEGTGFSLPAQSPVMLVRILLGLLKDATLRHQISASRAKLKVLKQQALDIERRPRDLMEHVKHHLSEALEIEEDSPFYSTNILEPDSLSQRAQQRIQQCDSDLAKFANEKKQYDKQRMEIADRSAEFRSYREMLANEIAQYQAAIEGNMDEVKRLQRAPEALRERLYTRCSHVGILLKDCSYVCKKSGSMDIDNLREARLRAGEIDRLHWELKMSLERMTQVQEELRPHEKSIEKLAEKVNYLQKREVESLALKQRLEQAIKDYDFYAVIEADPSKWETLKRLRDEIDGLSQIIDNLQLRIRETDQNYSKRRSEISNEMDRFAKVLGDEFWGVFNDVESGDNPFHIGPLHSTTYGVIETLMGDLVCLLDSSSLESNHPGFLLHDSPREAEMDEHIFWNMLSQVNQGEDAHYQYIVTTSTNTPKDFRSVIRLELNGQKDSGFLLRGRIGVEQRPLL